MAKTQLGNPNVIIKDVISNERFFIYELVIPENVGVRGKIVDFKKLIIYWKMKCEALSVLEISPSFNKPKIFAMSVNMIKQNFAIYFILEKLEYSVEQHKKCVAIAIFEHD